MHRLARLRHLLALTRPKGMWFLLALVLLVVTIGFVVVPRSPLVPRTSPLSKSMKLRSKLRTRPRAILVRLSTDMVDFHCRLRLKTKKAMGFKPRPSSLSLPKFIFPLFKGLRKYLSSLPPLKLADFSRFLPRRSHKSLEPGRSLDRPLVHPPQWACYHSILVALPTPLHIISPSANSPKIPGSGRSVS